MRLVWMVMLPWGVEDSTDKGTGACSPWDASFVEGGMSTQAWPGQAGQSAGSRPRLARCGVVCRGEGGGKGALRKSRVSFL